MARPFEPIASGGLSAEPWISAPAIAGRVRELGAAITRAYQGRNPILIGVLKGAALFTADLARAIDLDIAVDFIRAQSYAGTESAGQVALSRSDHLAIEGRHVILVEDIVDTGRTLEAIRKDLAALRPASLAVCTLLDKPSRRIIAQQPEYTGFVIEDRFVVGYGLDYDEHFRQLPAIHIYTPH